MERSFPFRISTDSSGTNDMRSTGRPANTVNPSNLRGILSLASVQPSDSSSHLSET